VPTVARRPEDAPREVAASVVAAVGAEERVPATSAVLCGAGKLPPCARLGGQQVSEEGRDVDRDERFHVRAPVRVVLRREPVKAAIDLPEWRSQTVMSSPVSEFSFRLSQYGRMNRRIWYSRFASVLGPTSCMACQRSIHSLIVIAPAPGSVHMPARTFASWSRPQVRACVGRAFQHADLL
jgi:hypothetical protein